MPLVTDGQMAALRQTAESGMVTDVDILLRSDSDDSDPYSDDTPSWTYSQTVKGWLKAMPGGDISVAMGYSGVASTFRLFLPVGTAVSPRDRVRIGGDDYTVQDTSRESTYKTLLRVMLERIE